MKQKKDTKFTLMASKDEYKYLPKEEQEIVDELASIIKKHKRSLGVLRTVECLRHALEIS